MLHQVKELVQDCESPILQETANKLADIHEEFEALEEEAAKQGLTTGQKALLPNDKSPDKQWKWTGSCFVKSPTVEPWVSLMEDSAECFYVDKPKI